MSVKPKIPWRRHRGRIATEVVTRLDAGADLESVLGSALVDPDLLVGYPLDDGNRFVSNDGTAVCAPSSPAEASTRLEHGGRVVALVVHRPGDAALIRGMAGACAIAVANEALSGELEASVAEVRRSRAEFVEALSGARRKVERDLHDGAQQRLVAASLDARMLLADSPDPEVRHALERTAEELQLSLGALRDLARGLFPANLPERGLGSALQSLADRAAVPIMLGTIPEPRVSRSVEYCAYFCVAAAAAVADGPLQVEVALEVDHILVTVRGPGVPRDFNALQAIGDRAEAIGGSIAIDRDAAGSDPALTVSLPLSESGRYAN